MTIQSILNFLKYNNAVPLILAVLLLSTGAAFAASPKLRQSVLTKTTVPFVTVPVKTDTSKLLAKNMNTFDFSLRIDAITEDAESYHIAYSYQTLEVASGAWQEIRKTGKMDVSKKLLGKRDLGTYLSDQIGQVMSKEIAYLSEVQIASTAKSAPKKSSKYSALIGQKIEKSKDMPKGNASDTGSVEEEASDSNQGIVLAAATATEEIALVQTLLSKEEMQKMIVAAVAEFLAIDTSMPEMTAIEIPDEEVVPVLETPIEGTVIEP